MNQLGEKEVKGEVTVIMGGGTPQTQVEPLTVLEALKYYSQEMGLSMKESVNRVSEELGISRREVYQESLNLKKSINH